MSRDLYEPGDYYLDWEEGDGYQPTRRRFAFFLILFSLFCFAAAASAYARELKCDLTQIEQSVFYKTCLDKTRRFRTTNATEEQRQYFICHCVDQYILWDLRDP